VQTICGPTLSEGLPDGISICSRTELPPCGKTPNGHIHEQPLMLGCGNLTCCLHSCAAGRSSEFRWCNRWWTVASMERPIAQHHGLPIASYRDAVWPLISQPDPMLPCFYNGLSHMDALGHMLFADTVAYAFVRSVQDTQRDQQQQLCEAQHPQEPFKFHQQAKGRRYCAPRSRPGSFMVAQKPGSLIPVAHSGCWHFYEDRPGKPGVWGPALPRHSVC
jgi:hypothetical protein